MKTAIITGGNKGIGLEITRAFAKSGYTVFVGSRSEVEFIPGVHHVFTDVRNEQDLANLVNVAVTETGGVDVFINNAGYSEWRAIEDIDNNFLDDILATNLKGAFWGCKAAARVMKSGGSIINISSIAGKRGSANNSAYVATKFGMNGLTQSLAKELGPRGIRVNGVCPVLIVTSGLLTALTGEGAPAEDQDPVTFIRNFGLNNAALTRLPTADEVANTCLFLASNSASAITGQNINIDCGVFPQ